MLVGLHTHTHPNSWDSFLKPDEAIDRAAELGFDAIVLTEHDWAWDRDQLVEVQKRHRGRIRVFAGMELNTEDGHVTCFGLHEYVFGMHRADELAGHVARVDGVMIANHPYRRQMPWRWDKEEDYAQALERAEANLMYRFVVGMELINGRGTIKENGFSSVLGRTMGFPGTAADDCHELKDIGRVGTWFEADIQTERDLIEAIRSGRYWPLDLSKGEKIADARYHDLPSDIEHEWAEVAEIRRRRAIEGAPEFRGRPADHPHVRELAEQRPALHG